jgi:hypothetical protein
MMRLIIDRFEGDIAVCELEDRSFIDIPKCKLPLEVKVGDCLVEKDKIYSIDYEITAKRKKVVNDKFNRLFKK